MFITFTGKGCRQCPFYFTEGRYFRMEMYCGLNNQQSTEGKLNIIITDPDIRPNNCPFSQTGGQIEVAAQE